MAIITITATELGSQLITGIPMLLSLETNVPSTIFYTFDGSEPTVFSAVYLEALLMPTISTVRVRAMAVSGSDKGYFDVTYSSDSSDLVYPRRIEGYGAGIVVDAYNGPLAPDGKGRGADGWKFFL